MTALKAGAHAHAKDLAPVSMRLLKDGCGTLAALASGLNAGGFETPRGGKWYPTSVANLLKRIEGANR